MSKKPTDKEILREIGLKALLSAGYSQDAIKQWRKRGIPWRERVKVAALASRNRVWIPADFLREQRGVG